MRCPTRSSCSAPRRSMPPPTCRRSRSPMSTHSAAARWCCGRKAAAGWSWPQPILAQAPRIRQNFLATERDWAVLRDGLRLVREVGRQAPLAEFVDAEIAPGPGRQSDADIDAHIRATAITVHHPLGTCRMGADRDEMAVVDPRVAGPRRRRAARRRRLGDAGPGRRQHQRAGHHDRGKGRRPDPRPRAARPGQRLSHAQPRSAR